MFEYPQYEEDGQERLSFENMWRSIEPQEVLGTDCFNPNATLTPEDNLIVLKLTAIEFTEIFSALYNGAVMTYPSRFMQILVNFLSGLHCPPILEEQECYDYPTYASFFGYSPMNPYLTPDEIPEGYETVPFEVNGENGVDLPNYEHFDIIVPTSALTLDVNWFEDIGGQLPQITVMVQGEGKALLKFLCIVGGGLVVVTVDNPPNLIDIIAGIVTGADNIIDLNQDIVSLPPETAIELIYEVDVVGTGIHTIYCVFLPILDDSLIPLRFGGGFRGATLCDFVEQPTMGIQNIRFDAASCELQVLEDGEWSQVTGWENWLDCVPSGGGGGTGSARIKVSTFNTIVSDFSTTSTTYVNAATVALMTKTYSKALVIVSNLLLQHSAGGQRAIARIVRESSAGLDNTETSVQGTTGRTVSVSDRWEDIEDGGTSYVVQLKTQTSGTASLLANAEVVVTVIEYEDAEDLFVEDIRIIDEELQKRIGGVWITVTESLKALFDAVQAAAAAAQATANGAVSVNTSQQTQINSIITVNNNQNIRLLELEVSDAAQNLQIAQINTINNTQTARLDNIDIINNYQNNLLSDLAQGGVWSWFINFRDTQGSFSVAGLDGYWVSGQGFFSENGSLNIESSNFIRQNQITHININVTVNNQTGVPNVRFRVNGSPSLAMVSNSSGGNERDGWIRVDNLPYDLPIAIEVIATNCNVALRTANFLGRGFDNPFT